MTALDECAYRNAARAFGIREDQAEIGLPVLVAELSQEMQTLFRLKYLESKSDREIALAMNTFREVIPLRLFDLRQAIRNKFASDTLR